MQFEVTEIVHHPLDRVYATCRDRLLELSPYLPNVDRIECLERVPLPEGVRLLNRWRASGAVPLAVRPFFSESMLCYLDHARWLDDEWKVCWRFEVGVLRQAVECEGTNFFAAGPRPGTTAVTLSGSLAIDLSRVRGVPRLFHGLAPRVERYILGHVKPNLVGVVAAVQRLLDEERTDR